MDNSKYRSISFLISIGASSIALIHLLLPSITIDSITLSLLIIAVLPWVAPLIKSVTLPNGYSIELQDWKNAVDSLVESDENISSINYQNFDGAPYKTVENSKEAIERLEAVKDNDSKLLIMSIRIEIEKSLRDYYDLVYDTEKSPSTYFILNNLSNDGFLTKKVATGIKEIIRIGNMISHGAQVDPFLKDWVESQSGELMKALDSLPFLVEALFPFDETKVNNEATFPALKRFTEYIKHGKNRLGRWFVAKRDPLNGDVSVILFQSN